MENWPGQERAYRIRNCTEKVVDTLTGSLKGTAELLSMKHCMYVILCVLLCQNIELNKNLFFIFLNPIKKLLLTYNRKQGLLCWIIGPNSSHAPSAPTPSPQPHCEWHALSHPLILGSASGIAADTTQAKTWNVFVWPGVPSIRPCHHPEHVPACPSRWFCVARCVFCQGMLSPRDKHVPTCPRRGMHYVEPHQPTENHD